MDEFQSMVTNLNQDLKYLTVVAIIIVTVSVLLISILLYRGTTATPRTLRTSSIMTSPQRTSKNGSRNSRIPPLLSSLESQRMNHGTTCPACLYIVTKIKPFLSRHSKALQAQWEAASPHSVLLRLTPLS